VHDVPLKEEVFLVVILSSVEFWMVCFGCWIVWMFCERRSCVGGGGRLLNENMIARARKRRIFKSIKNYTNIFEFFVVPPHRAFLLVHLFLPQQLTTVPTYLLPLCFVYIIFITHHCSSSQLDITKISLNFINRKQTNL